MPKVKNTEKLQGESTWLIAWACWVRGDCLKTVSSVSSAEGEMVDFKLPKHFVTCRSTQVVELSF